MLDWVWRAVEERCGYVARIREEVMDSCREWIDAELEVMDGLGLGIAVTLLFYLST